MEKLYEEVRRWKKLTKTQHMALGNREELEIKNIFTKQTKFVIILNKIFVFYDV